MNSSIQSMDNRKPDVNAAIRKRFAQIGVLILIIGISLFGTSGDPGWGMAWLFLASYVAMIAANAAILLPRNPELVAERAELKADVKTWDKWVGGLSSLMLVPTTLIIAGLDRRLGWTVDYGPAVHGVGLVVLLATHALFAWAMASNRFFSAGVRLQFDRGHSVQMGGPYRFVRHPGYLATIVGAFATPLLLGSLYALIPGTLAAVGIVVRTVLEDRTLQVELEGYAEYSRQTRFRLVPGVW